VALERDGALVPRFPNARYLLDRADWDLHFTPDGEQRPLAPSPFVGVNQAMRERLLVVRRAGQLDLVEGVHEVVPGVTTIPTPGETPGHRAVRVESAGAVCWLLGDLFHYAVELTHLDWLMPVRRDAVAMRASRERVLPRIVAEDALVTWSHADFPGWGRIVAADGGYRWQPIS
jgi:glyoxylase-like metal-dependent hydrolase (beta-lactamase superfamily II)